MSLRDDFEKDYRIHWEADDVVWAAYQAATERALRIVREEKEKAAHNVIDERLLLNILEYRLKGES